MPELLRAVAPAAAAPDALSPAFSDRASPGPERLQGLAAAPPAAADAPPDVATGDASPPQPAAAASPLAPPPMEVLAPRELGACIAAAIAVCTLNANADFAEVVDYFHWIKRELGLTTAGIVAILTVGQPLFIAWQDWKLALFIAVSFAIKMLYDESFHMGDVPFPRNLYRLVELRELERCVFKEGAVHLHTFEARLSKFRGALVEVLLTEPQLLPFIAAPRHEGRVLVVEDDPALGQLHAEMLQQVNPNFVITVCDDASTATALACRSAAQGLPFDLVLLDLVLKPGSVAHPSVLQTGEAGSSGFAFAEKFREAERLNSALHDYEFGRAFVVLVTSAVRKGAHRVACKLNGVDLVVSKPLQHEALNAISSFCWDCR